MGRVSSCTAPSYLFLFCLARTWDRDYGSPVPRLRILLADLPTASPRGTELLSRGR